MLDPKGTSSGATVDDGGNRGWAASVHGGAAEDFPVTGITESKICGMKTENEEESDANGFSREWREKTREHREGVKFLKLA